MPSNTRPPKDETDLRYWLENMVTHHRFQMDEVSAATGLSFKDIASALRRLEIPASPEVSSLNGLRVMPYPGGRHPRPPGASRWPCAARWRSVSGGLIAQLPSQYLARHFQAK